MWRSWSTSSPCRAPILHRHGSIRVKRKVNSRRRHDCFVVVSETVEDPKERNKENKSCEMTGDAMLSIFFLVSRS